MGITNTRNSMMNIDFADEKDRLIVDTVAQEVIDQVIDLCGKSDDLKVSVQSVWSGGQRWARNRSFLSSNLQTVEVMIHRSSSQGGGCGITMNQIDEESLRAACTFVEAGMARRKQSGFGDASDLQLDYPVWEAKGIPIWSDATYNRTAHENAQAVIEMTERAESNGMLAAGSIETKAAYMRGYSRDSWGREVSGGARATFAQCSTTVRHHQGVASGWSGASSFDLVRIDPFKLGTLAFDKCLKSMNPVRIEPGRYQTILEPQAVASFANIFVGALDRYPDGERPDGVHFLGWDAGIERARSKLGLQVIDRRITFSHDPEDPVTGTHLVPGMKAVDLVKDGVLTNMFTTYHLYGFQEQNIRDQNLGRSSYTMKGSESVSMDEMISTMKRGLLVTRFSDLTELHKHSLLYTGFTRDGLWLIENGKITKAVRNFRFTESPLFAFNNVESIGEPVPVMLPSWAKLLIAGSVQYTSPSVVVPALKINDFSFTSTIDAV